MFNLVNMCVSFLIDSHVQITTYFMIVSNEMLSFLKEIVGCDSNSHNSKKMAKKRKKEILK